MIDQKAQKVKEMTFKSCLLRAMKSVSSIQIRAESNCAKYDSNPEVLLLGYCLFIPSYISAPLCVRLTRSFYVFQKKAKMNEK